MAGENVPERVVRKVFSSSIDLVVHLDRSVDPSDNSIIRQAMEVRAVVPALHEDFSSEPIFTRPRLGAPLDWTGALPPADLVDRMERTLGAGRGLRSLLERGAGSW
jgi:pilus assembly protein CpaF